MELRLYTCPRYKKGVKSNSDLTRHVNTYKISVILLSCQLSTPAPILEYNTTNHPNLSLNYFEEDISPVIANNNKNKIRLADTRNNDNKNSRSIDINK